MERGLGHYVASFISLFVFAMEGLQNHHFRAMSCYHRNALERICKVALERICKVIFDFVTL